MSKLYEARKCTLTKPLSKEEIGYVYNSKVISPIIEDIKKKKYGSYLIGGVVGTGKSSQVEIATNYAIKNPLIIHVKFYYRSKISRTYGLFQPKCRNNAEVTYI